MEVLPICKTEMIILTSPHRTEPKEQKMLYESNSDSASRDGRTHEFVGPKSTLRSFKHLEIVVISITGLRVTRQQCLHSFSLSGVLKHRVSLGKSKHANRNLRNQPEIM